MLSSVKSNLKVKHLLFALAILVATTYLFTAALNLAAHKKANAGGFSPYNATITPSTTTATVGQTVTITVRSWDYKCAQTGYSSTTSSYCNSYGGVAGTEGTWGSSTITASGGGTTLSTTLLQTGGGPPNPGSFTLNASTAGSKTVTLYDPWKANLGSVTINYFNAASATVSASGSVSGSGSRHASSTSNVAATADGQKPAPAVANPEITQIKIGSQTVSTAKPVVVKVGQPLTLSGKTVANGIVTLYIHSKERTVTTKADKDGIWKYTISQLPVGSHSIEAQVMDPKTKQQSAKTSLLNFAIKPSKSAATTKPIKNNFSPWSMIIFPAILAAAILTAAFFGWRRYGRKKPADASLGADAAIPAPEPSTPEPPASDGSTNPDNT
ncbi:MAG TPA: hypothetical protein VFH99_02265 [Candidatus Saccharimonadales bacterium]|nr:hypothetical protein [Candidatus Saccharimonadales bacterium]